MIKTLKPGLSFSFNGYEALHYRWFLSDLQMAEQFRIFQLGIYTLHRNHLGAFPDA